MYEFQFPVKLTDGIIYSKKPLKYCCFQDFELIPNQNQNEYEIKYKTKYGSKKPHKIELLISTKNFPISINWFKPNYNSVMKESLKHIKNDLSPSEWKYLLNGIYSDFDQIPYYERIAHWNGIEGLLNNIRSLECLKLSIKEIHLEKEKIINHYNFTDIQKYAYHAESLIPKFLVRTSGFNQCFLYKKNYYSSVSLKQFENKYCIYIYGCDDSSYSKYVDSLQEAEREIKKLQVISPILSRYHIHYLKYEFTN